MLQDAVITMRDGRYCLPVKSEYKSSFQGMVHDQSATGSTLFIEPMAIIKLNNEIRELEIREQKEIEMVLAALSMELVPYTDPILTDFRILTRLDFIFAKAALSKHYNCSMPVFNNNGYIHIKDGRHPLLDPKKVVPINVYLGRDFDLLIVTGPNTGGKTVSLKTVGLFTLMGQSGLQIPAFDGSELSVFDEVFADIGDEQSIEQSLSTFSAHMTNIVKILEQADSHSLCLFDELGAGTDPTEGAALAIAVLSFLHNMKCRTMATTHYSELKVFALTTPAVENACCEFDVETLRPTYRLLIGIPGKSNAFAISKKLGLPDYIIDDAKSRLESNDEAFEDLLANLETSRVTIEKEREEIANYKAEIARLKKNLEQKEELKALAEKTVYTGAIDAYFDYSLGALEYRSVRFETELLDTPNFQGNAAVNYTDAQTPWTRIIEHKWFEFGKDDEGHDLPKTVISREYSSEWKPGDEPYYPVNDEKNGALYQKYKELAEKEKNVIFGGRLGEYKYYDMDAVIASALEMCEKELG